MYTQAAAQTNCGVFVLAHVEILVLCNRVDFDQTNIRLRFQFEVVGPTITHVMRNIDLYGPLYIWTPYGPPMDPLWTPSGPLWTSMDPYGPPMDPYGPPMGPYEPPMFPLCSALWTT